jgi:hypothetical protein
MPKVKQAIILVTVHEDGTPQASVTHVAANHAGKELGLAIVEVWPNDLPGTLIESTAHEFGHVLASIFETPARTKDPRHMNSVVSKLIKMGIMPPNQAMVDAEAEAWDFAQKMYADLDPATRKANLDTYKDGLEMWHKEAAAS